MAAAYDVFQQVFSLSLLSNSLITLQGSQTNLQQQIEKNLQQYLTYNGSQPSSSVTDLLGDWSVVWGPVVYQSDKSNTADNVVYVAQSTVTFPDNSTKNTYVVAIAGTAAESTFDWDDEDGLGGTSGSAITGVVSWTDFLDSPTTTTTANPASDAPYISLGTATGVSTLLQLTDATTKDTLSAFLAKAGADVLVVTGHSLGGALSATLGLYLVQSNATPNIPTTYVYPTAGASPGNDVFATEEFSTHLPAAIGSLPWQSWNVDIWNTNDIVPQAWSIAAQDSTIRTLNNVNGIYQNNPALADVGTLTARLIGWSKNSTVTYSPVNGASFTAALVTSFSFDGLPVSLNVPPKNFRGFALQALYQHSTAYSLEIFANTTRLPASTVPLVSGVTKEGLIGLLAYFAKLFGVLDQTEEALA
ncbi:lipase family protein [Azospirillum doebereinerae]